MQYCVDHPEELDKVAKVKAQISEVKGIMMENIEKVNSNFCCLNLSLISLNDDCSPGQNQNSIIFTFVYV
jgi:hypothetical protein